MSRDYDFFVYMVTNFSGSVLYTGVTNDLPRRIWEHQHGESNGFTKDYHVDRLVFFEHYGDVRDAIAREKQIKGWTRTKKEALIRTLNPTREDITYRLDPGWRLKPIKPPEAKPQGKPKPTASAELEGPSTALVPRSAQDDKEKEQVEAKQAAAMTNLFP